jgi:hypothetical protein
VTNYSGFLSALNPPWLTLPDHSITGLTHQGGMANMIRINIQA